MIEIIKAIVIFVLYIAEYFLFGICFQKICKKKSTNVQMQIIVGMFVQAVLFFILVIPMKVMQISVGIISTVWLITCSIMILAIIVACHKDIRESLLAVIHGITKHKIETSILGVIIGAEIVFEELYGRILGGTNATYYIGYVTSSLHMDRLGTVNPRTGEVMGQFNISYLLQTYLDHSVVISWLTGIHPLIEIRTVIPAITILVSNLVIWEIAKTICRKDYKKAMYVWIMYNALSNIFSCSVLLPAFYGYFRSFEGKNFFACITIPLLFLLFWKLYDEPKDKYILSSLVVAITGSFMYCMSTMFIVPFIILGYAGMILIKKSWKQFVNVCICMIPCIMVVVYYMLATKGIIVLAIH